MRLLAGASGFAGATGQTGVTGGWTLLPHVSASPGLILKGVQVHRSMGMKVSMRHNVQALVASPA